ncbi:alpha/beta fold hydrolase [Streptomyces tuirus]
MANQLGMVFSQLDCTPRWRERLPGIEVPTLVVHSRRNRFFPVGNGEAIAREIPGARLLVLEEAATAIPDTAADEVTEAMLTLGQRTAGGAGRGAPTRHDDPPPARAADAKRSGAMPRQLHE